MAERVRYSPTENRIPSCTCPELGFSTGLDQGTTYAVEVRARNAGGVGPGTATKTATTETLKVSIRHSGDTTVTEGQQSLPASNTNRPVYSIAVIPLAVEADPTKPHGHRPGWANDRAYRSTATVAKGQTSATWEFLTNQNQAVNTIDTQAASIEYTINDDDATPGQVCWASLWQKPIDTLTYTCSTTTFSGQQDGQGVPVLRLWCGTPPAAVARWPARLNTTVDGRADAPRFQLTSLADNQAVDLQIRAVNNIGPGPYLSINAKPWQGTFSEVP